MSRSRARHIAVKRPSMALTTFASFSTMVAVSVAFSNGSVPTPWESASAKGESLPSLFAAVPNEALISNAQDNPRDYVASQVRNVSDSGTGSAPSSVAPSKRAPATFEGELPVNTIIAPAQPPTVLEGGQFGWRTAPDTKEREFHNGTDISASEGTPVVAALDGTVTAIFWDEWGGNRVEVSHADGMKTTYNHLKDVMVRVGDPLRASEQLGTIGQTGLRVVGPHLHFETWVEGKPVDAQSFDWETGEGIIPASRPKYSLEDQARTDEDVSGTDNGSIVDIPDSERDRIIALSREVSPAERVPADDDRKDARGPFSGAKSGSDGAAPGPVPAPRAAQSRPSHSGGWQSPSAESGSAQPAPSRSTPGANHAAVGRVNAGAPSEATPSRPSGGSGVLSNTPQTHSGGNGKSAADKAAKDKAAKDSAAKKATEEAKKEAAPEAKANPPAPVPDPSKPQAPKPGTPPAAKKPAVNPYTADITQLTTLEQIKQRTQVFVNEQLTLTPEQQFGPGSQLNAQLPLLSQQLVSAKVEQQDPEFKDQLSATQTAVEKAAAAPHDKKLTDAAIAELTELQTMLAGVPAYVDPAAAPAG